VLVDGSPEIRKRADHSCVYLIDNKCSIYNRRPQSCRAFDCRVYLFAGVAPTPQFDPPMYAALARWRTFRPRDREDAARLSIAERHARRLHHGYGMSRPQMADPRPNIYYFAQVVVESSEQDFQRIREMRFAR
jgi:hypothetical protein